VVGAVAVARGHTQLLHERVRDVREDPQNDLLQYLEQDAIDALLRFTAALPTGSEFVCSFVPPDDELDGHDLDIATEGAAHNAALGEPWKSRFPARDLIERLAHFGFSNIFHLTPELARQRYFSDHHDIQRRPRWEQIMAAIV
jgi:O-methyltransferase involved in polyketide biosynthesis